MPRKKDVLQEAVDLIREIEVKYKFETKDPYLYKKVMHLYNRLQEPQDNFPLNLEDILFDDE